MEGLIFNHFTVYKTGIYVLRVHDFSMLHFAHEKCPPHSQRPKRMCRTRAACDGCMVSQHETSRRKGGLLQN